jgi:hypothetical protein
MDRIRVVDRGKPESSGRDTMWTVIRYAIASTPATLRFVLILVVITAASGGMRIWL